MSILAARKCVRHSGREAIARCPSCQEHYCRECVVEHAGVLLCATCLTRENAANANATHSRRSRLVDVLLTMVCVGLLWVVFYGFGQLLKTIPAEVHEGSIWRAADS